MKSIDDSLTTPVFAKTSGDEEWPRHERVFYILGTNGLFLCRNHEFFESCVLAPRFPTELQRQREFLRVNYPRPPARVIETIVGFFDRVWRLYGGEAGAVLAWNREREEVQVIIPTQVATVSPGGGDRPHPVGLHYSVDAELAPDTTIFCDIHSHCHLAAYASVTDRADETHRTGLHAVVGRLDREPPEFHVDAVVDGVRFRVDSRTVFGGYERRRVDFPPEWMDRVEARPSGAVVFRRGGASQRGADAASLPDARQREHRSEGGS